MASNLVKALSSFAFMVAIPLVIDSSANLDIKARTFNLKLSINPSFNVKLDYTSYLIWKEQLKQVITIYYLQDFIDGMEIPPPKIIKKLVKNVDTNTKEIRVQELFEEKFEYSILG